jgi:hypothetical protein
MTGFADGVSAVTLPNGVVVDGTSGELKEWEAGGAPPRYTWQPPDGPDWPGAAGPGERDIQTVAVSSPQAALRAILDENDQLKAESQRLRATMSAAGDTAELTADNLRLREENAQLREANRELREYKMAAETILGEYSPDDDDVT